ncbi:MAG: hypothetical protein ACK4NC_07220 [Candidatus Gracilibacteria bacterium]
MVNPELLYLVAEEKENFIDTILIHAYELPLKNSHPILREIADNLIIAELMRVYYQGVGLSNVTGDVNNMANDMVYKAYQLLGGIVAGRNVALPVPPPRGDGMHQPMAYILQGEVQKPPEALLIAQPMYSAPVTRHSSTKHMGIEWEYEAPRNDRVRARGGMLPRGTLIITALP